ncbi:hypothetical protein AVEN_42908-1 [Araneus ventricosus]|uniref:Uncharacterized protein n=1 Tax=Araneus ventricosus TaxID=182803 RepID=A0A4Y2AEY5_ARAVE|nr:hypothetical protein AVEN_42908-1 [Araneus ventricosus]
MNVGSNDVQCPSRFLFHRADWTNFTLRALITLDMVEGDNINEVVNFVTKTIILAADASIPKSGLSFPKSKLSGLHHGKRRGWKFPEPVAVIPFWVSWGGAVGSKPLSISYGF